MLSDPTRRVGDLREEENPMTFENMDMDNEFDELETEALPEESNNRMFFIVAGVLGAIALLAMICIAVYALVLLPRSREAQTGQKATLDAQNTEVAFIIEQTSTAAAVEAIKAAYTATPTETQVPDTPTPTSSPTPVVAMASEVTTDQGIVLTIGPEMATATALHATLTANAALYEATLTARAAKPTSIPNTGFADDVGLPMMIGLAGLLIVVVFLARRLRST